MTFSWKNQRQPYICLAPMAGYTDSAFRQIVKEIAPEVILFSEMVSSDGLKYNSKTNLNLIKRAEIEKPFIVQLFGKKPENFQAAAKIMEENGADGIDINMGCPANKVIKSSHGAALIKSPELAEEIVQATAEATKLPVSVKTRLGWDDDANLVSFCQKMEKAGAKMLTIHGRTYKQGFRGEANWEPIYNLKKVLNIPVIGNGDIKSAKDAQDKLQNLNGIMVGRATFGNPWLMQEICDVLLHNQSIPKTPENIVSIWIKIHKPLIIKHCEKAVACKGERIAMNEMRKHLAAYVKGLPNASELRSKLVLVKNIKEVKKHLQMVL